tara:strand:+ start:4932 stop:5204 length:273 start_codon:yes stop_codon:yes gene_type:complete
MLPLTPLRECDGNAGRDNFCGMFWALPNGRGEAPLRAVWKLGSAGKTTPGRDWDEGSVGELSTKLLRLWVRTSVELHSWMNSISPSPIST